jgi:hypothetical protein
MRRHYSVGQLMVRVLASLIVVCLVAATGVRPAAVAPEQRSTLKVARTGERLHARVVESAPGRVVSHASGAGRLSRAPGAAGPELAAIAPASRAALGPPRARSTGPSAREPLVVAFRSISTRSARGPPVV